MSILRCLCGEGWMMMGRYRAWGLFHFKAPLCVFVCISVCMHATSLSNTSGASTVKKIAYFFCWKLGGRQRGVREGKTAIRTQLAGRSVKIWCAGEKRTCQKQGIIHIDMQLKKKNQYTHKEIRMYASRADCTNCCVWVCLSMWENVITVWERERGKEVERDGKINWRVAIFNIHSGGH